MTYEEWERITRRLVAALDGEGLFKAKEVAALYDFLSTVKAEDFEKAAHR